MTSKTAEYKDFVTAAIKWNIDNLNLTEEDYKQTISDDFIFYVADKEYNLDDWIAHMKALKAKRKSLKVTFEQMIGEDDSVAAVYFINGVNHDDSELMVKIIAFFKVRDRKITYCNELVHLIKGHWG